MGVNLTYVLMSPSIVENRTNEEFMKVCSAKTVPAIDDNGFKLFERLVNGQLNSLSLANFKNLHLVKILMALNFHFLVQPS